MPSRCQRVELIRTVTMKSGKPRHGSEKVTEVEMPGLITNLEIYSTRPDRPTIFIVQTNGRFINCARWNLLRIKILWHNTVNKLFSGGISETLATG